MRFGMRIPKNFVGPRRETRIPMEVGVHITGHPAMPGTETTFTENVSPHGARVLSTRRWNTGDRLTISTLTGAFRAIARVAYCQTTPRSGFAVGLEFVEPSGNWVVAESCAS
jgi:PilZ domain